MLHHIFYTNNMLIKMGIKKINLCSFCSREIDSVEHMLLQCEISHGLWLDVGNWISELGMENYHLSDTRIIPGDLENASSINTIILFTKKAIYNSMKMEQKPNIINVKNDVKSFYFQKEYR